MKSYRIGKGPAGQFGLLGCLTLLALLAWPGRAQADLTLSLNNQVHIQADLIEYLKDQNLVMAKGQVHIQQGSVHLYADSIRYDVVAQDVQATGHVVWQDEHQEVESKSLIFNLRTGEGKAFHIKTTEPPWISTGSEIDMMRNKIVIKDAVTTTCDYPEEYEHFRMKADRITIYSGDYLVAENVVLFIGKVPVFYFPFFVRTIHDIKTPFSITTGSTDFLGTYILLTSSYLLNPKSYGALYTDYYFKKGLGLGVRHEIALNDYSVLSLYGYGVQQKDDQKFRWESRIRGLWAFSSSLQGRVEADLPGDGFFSNDYSVARRDPSLVTTVREYDLSATWTQNDYSVGLLGRLQETVDPTDPNETTFMRSLETTPQLTFSLFPQPFLWKNWLKYDVSFQGDHTWTQANGYFVNHGSGNVGLGQSLLFLSGQSLYSRVELDETIQDVPDAASTLTGINNAGETHSLNIQNTWTSRWAEYFNSSFSYNFTQKLNNRLPTDSPTGVTSNLLSGFGEFTLGSLIRARTSTSFDFNAQGVTDGGRFSFLRQELYLTPSPLVDYLGIVDYSIQANALKDLNTVLTLRSPRDMWRFRISGNYVDPNVDNTGFIGSGLPPTFNIAGEVDFSFFTNYRISLIESYDLTNSQFQNRSISIYRDLHDWEAQLTYSQDPLLGSKVFFTLDLKAFPGRPISVSDDQLTRMSGIRNQGLTGAASQFQ